MKAPMRFLSLLILTVLSICSNGYAQDRGERGDEDPGIDVAIVISIRANLRERPSTSSTVLREVKRGDVFALVNRIPVGPWYSVIHIKSSTEGWINGNTIRIQYTEKRQAGPVFEERSTGTTNDPTIQVTNDSDRILYLKVGEDDRIVISQHATRTMTKSLATYSFYASSPGAIPALGQHDFRSGHCLRMDFLHCH